MLEILQGKKHFSGKTWLKIIIFIPLPIDFVLMLFSYVPGVTRLDYICLRS